jgi:hypothetical protein
MNTLWEIRRNLLALFVAGVAVVCVGVTDAHASAAISWPTHGWQQGTPASVGLDDRTLVGLDADIAAGKYGLVDSIDVFRCGEQVFERKYVHDYSSI